MKTGRNEPCACGSGKKYKKCCGIVQQLTNESPRIPTYANRQCGECALCCHGWLTTRVLDIDIHVGKPCPHAAKTHCMIHTTRPDNPCRAFFCGWVEQNSSLPDWMQPSRCGVIVLTGRMSWRGRPVDIIVNAGADPQDNILAWMQKRCIHYNRPFIYQQREQWFGYGSTDFQRDIARKIMQGVPLWDGSMDKVVLESTGV